MADVVITLQQIGHALKPVGGNPQRVPAGSIVMFTIADPRIKGTTLEFKGNSFPFAEQKVSYHVQLPVTVAFNASDRNKNIYKFRCHATGPNGEPLDSEEGGGEMEIVPGG
jgi:hypothetical protein